MNLLLAFFIILIGFTALGWDGDITSYIGNNKFCECGFGGKCTNWICSGGGTGGAANACSADACTSGQYSFSAADGWTIKSSQTGAPYRAFARMPFCGENIGTGTCWTQNPQTFAFQFKLSVTPTGPWPGNNKILFWGDGNDFMNILANTYDIAVFPQGDNPPNGQAGKVTILPDTWNTVVITFDLTLSSSTATFVINGGAPITGTFRSVWSGGEYLMMGSYHWTTNTGGKEMILSFKDMCLGTAPNCPNFSGVVPNTQAPTTPMRPPATPTQTPGTPTSSPSSKVPTSVPITTNSPAPTPPTGGSRFCACTLDPAWCTNAQSQSDLYMSANCLNKGTAGDGTSSKVGVCQAGTFTIDSSISCGCTDDGLMNTGDACSTAGACSTWASRGECENNAIYMQQCCRKSCSICTLAPAPSGTILRTSSFLSNALTILLIGSGLM